MKINRELKLEALALADELLDAIDQSEFAGVTIMQASNATGVPYRDLYGLALRLEDAGKIKLVRDQRSGNTLRLVRPDNPCLEFAKLLTPGQQKTLDYLSGRADARGLVHASISEISRAVGTYCYSFIEGLDRRGFLEILHRGDCKRPRLYQIFPNGDGPKGWSATWFTPAKTVPLYATLTKEKDNAETN